MLFYEVYAVLALGLLGWLLWWEMRPRFVLVPVDTPETAFLDPTPTASTRSPLTLPGWWGPRVPKVATHAHP